MFINFLEKCKVINFFICSIRIFFVFSKNNFYFIIEFVPFGIIFYLSVQASIYQKICIFWYYYRIKIKRIFFWRIFFLLFLFTEHQILNEIEQILRLQMRAIFNTFFVHQFKLFFINFFIQIFIDFPNHQIQFLLWNILHSKFF